MNDFFVQFPDEETGRYVRFEMSMVSTPDSDDVTGILTVIDITEQVVADRILHQRSVTGYDFVVDVDLRRDTYTILSQDENAVGIPPHRGCPLTQGGTNAGIEGGTQGSGTISG